MEGELSARSPNAHCQNAAKQAIQAFKANFFAILAEVAPNFPSIFWDRLLPIHSQQLLPSQRSAIYFNSSLATYLYQTLHSPLFHLIFAIHMHNEPQTAIHNNKRRWDPPPQVAGMQTDCYCGGGMVVVFPVARAASRLATWVSVKGWDL